MLGDSLLIADRLIPANNVGYKDQFLAFNRSDPEMIKIMKNCHLHLSMRATEVGVVDGFAQNFVFIQLALQGCWKDLIENLQ